VPDPTEFRLGIIGGCLSHQSDIPYSVLYHRQLDRRLRSAAGIRLKVAIARHFDRDYHERLASLLEGSTVDGVLLHLRVVFTAKSALLVNRLEAGRRYYTVHPFLFKRAERGWNERLAAKPGGGALFSSREPERAGDADQDPFDVPTPSKKLFGFRLRSLNLAAGALAGLDDWAIADEFAMFDRFCEACTRRGMPFFVLGPTPVTTYPGETRLWRKMNQELQSRLSGTGVPFCLLEALTDEGGNPMLKGDGLHLNEWGHAHVARRLYETLTPWIVPVLHRRQD